MVVNVALSSRSQKFFGRQKQRRRHNFTGGPVENTGSAHDVTGSLAIRCVLRYVGAI